MSRQYEEFDVDNCTQDQLNCLADHIENYITVLTSSMVIPEKVQEKHGKEIEESIKRSKKLITKLREGKAPLIDLDYD